MSTHLKAGDQAPDFSAVTADGRRIGLADFRGRKLVLYFYPRDDTPHCTRQACSLRDSHAEIAARGAAVVGVSAQGEESHRRFAQKHRIDFPLLADTGLEMARAYGVAGSGMAGLVRAVFKASERVTFIIDEAGRIARIIEAPDWQEHGAEVLACL